MIHIANNFKPKPITMEKTLCIKNKTHLNNKWKILSRKLSVKSLTINKKKPNNNAEHSQDMSTKTLPKAYKSA